MRLHKDAVSTGGDGGSGNQPYKFWFPASHAIRLVRLLKRVCDIHDDGDITFLHLIDITVIHHKVVISIEVASVGEHHGVVAGALNFFDCEAHRLAGQELTFLDVDGLPCFCGCHEQVGLAAEEGWYLKDVNIFSGHCGFLTRMDISDGRDSEFLGDNPQHVKSALVTDALEGVETGAVSLTIGAFEDERDVETLGNLHQSLCYSEGRLLIFNNARTGEKEEPVWPKVFQKVIITDIHYNIFQFAKILHFHEGARPITKLFFIINQLDVIDKQLVLGGASTCCFVCREEEQNIAWFDIVIFHKRD